MKKTLLSLFSILILAHSFAQNVGIGTATPAPSAKLDITSTNSGLLVPRVALTMTSAPGPVTAPANSLLVYNTATVADVTPGYYYWTGTAWARLATGSSTSWDINGNTGITGANFLGTINAADLMFRTANVERMRVTTAGNVGVGLNNPGYGLELNGTFGFGNGVAGTYRSRTETRNDAGQIATQSGMFETSAPVNYPTGASSWWHLIDVRHSNSANNYALQISGSFFDQDLYFRKTNNNGAQAWSRILTSTTGWTTIGNGGTNAATNFIGTTDGIDFVTRTNNIERMRVTSAGSVGIGIAAPTQRLDVQGGNARINNAFIGDVGHGAAWAGFANSSQANTVSYSLLASSDGNFTFLNKRLTGIGYIGFRINNGDVAVINEAGNMGIGTTTPAANARLQVVGGAIMPQTGNNTQSGIYFPPNPGGGGGDEAYIRHYVEAGENTKLVIANVNDSDDDIAIVTGLGTQERINVNGNGTVRLNRSVFYDCNDCGSTTGYDLTDGAGGNWGDLAIQGRVLSTNSNLHLSPPGGSRVIINSVYRSAGGGAGTTGLDIEDGGIRMRKNYMYFQRFLYCGGCYGVGSATYDLGNWDFCAVAQVGFRNTNSTTDEDDDVQCAVYPTAEGGAGEQTNYTSYYTYQFNARPAWRMYFEAFADTNGITCAASCWNLD